MSYARSSSGVGVGDPSSMLGSSSLTFSSSTCSLKGELEKGLKIFSDQRGKSTRESEAATGGSKVATEGICSSSGKRSKTEGEDRETRK